jgi:hypothetical protein
MVDAVGEPLVLYHGTDQDFSHSAITVQANVSATVWCTATI